MVESGNTEKDMALLLRFNKLTFKQRCDILHRHNIYVCYELYKAKESNISEMEMLSGIFNRLEQNGELDCVRKEISSMLFNNSRQDRMAIYINSCGGMEFMPESEILKRIGVVKRLGLDSTFNDLT